MKPAAGLIVCGTMLLARADLRAQESGGSPSPAPSTRVAAPTTAPLEDRISAARSVKVVTSILGIELGSDLDEAHDKLDKLCAPGTRPKEEGEEAEEKEGKAGEAGAKKEKDAGEHETRTDQPKFGEEQEEGHKVLWQLAGTDYRAIYITADDKEHIDSITAFLRPETQTTFADIGEVSKAPAKDDRSVVWDVLRPDRPLFRVVASGSNGKADSVRLFIVPRKSGGVTRHDEK